MVNDQQPPVHRVDSLGHPGNIHALAAGNVTLDEAAAYKGNTESRLFTARAMFGKDMNRAAEPACNALYGSSYVSLADAVRPPTITTSLGVMSLYANERQEMAIAQMEVEAAGVFAGRHKFLSALYPALDYLAYECDVPIHVNTIGLFDKKYPVTTLFFVSPYFEKKLKGGHRDLGPEVRAVLALYREAKSTSSAAYKILNYYKIIEGVQLIAKPKLFKEATQRGVPVSSARDMVPDHPDYPPDMVPWVGKTIGDFRENLLRETYRNAVSHFALDDETNPKAKLPPLDLGSPVDLGRLEDMVLPAELCARIVIDNYLSVLTQLGLLPEAGRNLYQRYVRATEEGPGHANKSDFRVL